MANSTAHELQTMLSIRQNTTEEEN